MFMFGPQASRSGGGTSEGVEWPQPSWWEGSHLSLLQGNWLYPSYNTQLCDAEFHIYNLLPTWAKCLHTVSTAVLSFVRILETA